MHHLPSRYIPCDGRLTASAYFKSTLPAWGATNRYGCIISTTQISIHAPRMGSDMRICLTHGSASYFNPRSPHGERLKAQRKATVKNISIHAPRMGSDLSIFLSLIASCDFNPRSPHGERPHVSMKGLLLLEFQSTLPAWGATEVPPIISLRFYISIHAPRMGSDHWHFPLHPERVISIHAPRMGSDHANLDFPSILIIFQSTLPAWGATGLSIITSRRGRNFNPRSPHGERHVS